MDYTSTAKRLQGHKELNGRSEAWDRSRLNDFRNEPAQREEEELGVNFIYLPKDFLLEQQAIEQRIKRDREKAQRMQDTSAGSGSKVVLPASTAKYHPLITSSSGPSSAARSQLPTPPTSQTSHQGQIRPPSLPGSRLLGPAMVQSKDKPSHTTSDDTNSTLESDEHGASGFPSSVPARSTSTTTRSTSPTSLERKSSSSAASSGKARASRAIDLGPSDTELRNSSQYIHKRPAHTYSYMTSDPFSQRRRPPRPSNSNSDKYYPEIFGTRSSSPGSPLSDSPPQTPGAPIIPFLQLPESSTLADEASMSASETPVYSRNRIVPSDNHKGNSLTSNQSGILRRRERNQRGQPQLPSKSSSTHPSHQFWRPPDTSVDRPKTRSMQTNANIPPRGAAPSSSNANPPPTSMAGPDPSIRPSTPVSSAPIGTSKPPSRGPNISGLRTDNPFERLAREHYEQEAKFRESIRKSKPSSRGPNDSGLRTEDPFEKLAREHYEQEVKFRESTRSDLQTSNRFATEGVGLPRVSISDVSTQKNEGANLGRTGTSYTKFSRPKSTPIGGEPISSRNRGNGTSRSREQKQSQVQEPLSNSARPNVTGMFQAPITGTDCAIPGSPHSQSALPQLRATSVSSDHQLIDEPLVLHSLGRDMASDDRTESSNNQGREWRRQLTQEQEAESSRMAQSRERLMTRASDIIDNLSSDKLTSEEFNLGFRDPKPPTGIQNSGDQDLPLKASFPTPESSREGSYDSSLPHQTLVKDSALMPSESKSADLEASAVSPSSASPTSQFSPPSITTSPTGDHQPSQPGRHTPSPPPTIPVSTDRIPPEASIAPSSSISSSSNAAQDLASIPESIRPLFKNNEGLKLLPGIIDRDSLEYIGGGAYGDVYKTLYHQGDTISLEYPEVAVKILRCAGTFDTDTLNKRMKKLRRELTVWHTLKHDNIVPFVGISIISGVLPAILSVWMPQGSLRTFLMKSNELSINRDVLMIDITRGLKHLHGYEPSIIHGDLKADNVLIDHSGNARLCDFGLSRMLEDTTLWVTSASTLGTIRWTAPELLLPSESGQTSVTAESDIYSLGMTCYEVYTGLLPFHRYPNDGAIVMAVGIRGEIPQRVAGSTLFTDEMWDLCNRCWAKDPLARPTSSDVLDILLKLPLGLKTENPASSLGSTVLPPR